MPKSRLISFSFVPTHWIPVNRCFHFPCGKSVSGQIQGDQGDHWYYHTLPLPLQVIQIKSCRQYCCNHHIKASNWQFLDKIVSNIYIHFFIRCCCYQLQYSLTKIISFLCNILYYNIVFIRWCCCDASNWLPSARALAILWWQVTRGFLLVSFWLVYFLFF